MPGRKDAQLFGRLGMALSIPTVLAVGPLVGYWAGAWLDRRWHTQPWAVVAGLVLGGLASGIQVYRILRWISAYEHRHHTKPS